MCTSKCNGNCKSKIDNKELDLKKSMNLILETLFQIGECNQYKNDLNNPSNKTTMENIEKLKIKAKLLLNEVNCNAGNQTHDTSLNNRIYDSENIFENLTLKERINRLKEKIHLFENSPGHDISLTELNAFSF